METCIAKSAQWRILSPAVLAALLGGFVLLYALYFGVQLEYFLGAFWGELPAHFTFSEYARKGYFELCQLMTLNFTVLALAAKCSTVPLRKTKALKTAAVVLLISSLLFAATAFAKLGLYISAYGITELRMLSCWGVSVLCVAVALALASIHRARPVFAKLMYVACASFTVLCFLCV